MRVSRVLVPVVAALAAVTLSGPTASAVAPTTLSADAATAVATVPMTGFQSSAWGTDVSALDATIRSGRTSASSVSCTSATGVTRTNSLPSVTLPIVGSVGAVSSRVTTSAPATTTATSQTAGVNLLGGAVVATAITVSSTASGAGASPTGSGSVTFAGLKVLGQSISATVAPNTRIALTVGGTTVGTVTLNYQGRGTANNVYTAQTRGILISLLPGNPYGLPGSTTVTVGGANAGVTNTPKAATNGGSGWGISASALGGAVVVGRQPNVGAPCFGGTASGTIANVSRDLLLATGTTTVNANAINTPTRTSTNVVTSVAGPRILAGLISADAIVADSLAARKSDGSVGVLDQSKFVGLRVLGFPAIDADVAPNTTIEIPVLGSVTFHKTVRTPQGLEVVMLEVKLNQVIAGLPTGTVIQVGAASATVLG